MQNAIKKIFQETAVVKAKALDENINKIEEAIKVIIKALQTGNKILFFGNGGSAADSQHLAAEFVGRFQMERKALSAISLTTDTSVITSLANDYSFDCIFKRQIEALGNKGDIAFGISTSGNSKNVIEGIKKAKDQGLVTIALTGNDGGVLKKISDICLIVPSKSTARIQESHSVIGHTICELVEKEIKR